MTDRASSGPGRRSGRWAAEEPRDINAPRPGCYRLRLVKGGPLVSARLWIGPPLDPETREPLDRSPRPMVQVANFPATDDPRQVERVWLYAETIDEATFAAMRARAAYARLHRPDEPTANPNRAADLSAMRPPF